MWLVMGLRMGNTHDGGPADAQARMVGLLKAAQARQGLSQKAWADKAGVSAGALSKHLSGQTVPSAAVLNLLAKPAGISGEALTELLRLRDRAAQGTGRLDGYLAAALAYARHQPYAGVLPGHVPPLAAVYVRQQVQHSADPLSGDTPPSHGSAAMQNPPAVRPAEDILDGTHPTCLILAGPGGGKSSLLRTRLAHATERWQAGKDRRLLPVMVSAAALDGRPLAQALTTAAERALPLAHSLPAGLFNAPPAPAARWLVLIDSLDEVIDPVARHRILTRLADIANGPHAELYRFAIASRPLPEPEFAPLGHQTPHYHLQPLEEVDLHSLTRAWFGALNLHDPDQAAERFATAISRSGLAHLARVPLMTAMLCQLHASHPQRPLPDSRGRLYQDFVTLLHKHQRVSGTTGEAAVYASIRNYGTSAHNRAVHTLNHLHDLISHLAAQRLIGNTRPTLEILSSQPNAQRPPAVAEDDWQKFLTHSLCHSGVLTFCGDDFAFLHQTLLEYFAARHATRTRLARNRHLRQLPLMAREDDAVDPLPAITPRDSYYGFILDAARETAPATVDRRLTRLASHRAGATYTALQCQIGTDIPLHIRSRAADLLDALARDPAVEAGARLQASRVLSELDASRAAALLDELARDPALDIGFRLGAGWVLGQLDASRAVYLFDAFARDPTLQGTLRRRAAHYLGGLVAPSLLDLLADFARDPTLQGTLRRRAARLQGGLEASRAVDLLDALARDAALEEEVRFEAAWAMRWCGAARAVDLFDALARDAALEDMARIKAVEELGRFRALGRLDALARDRAHAPLIRMEAARELANIDDSRAADLYAAIARGPEDDFIRILVVSRLGEIRAPRAVDLLDALAHEASLEKQFRDLAARVLKSRAS
ncbi:MULTISPECIES: helix-turn-helix domain-containing protein [Streptomyces]|uniref:helix-turn-helix domain-containing protein n=1 Tax=Streptomyces TaxID=1883 RepID=UPI00287FEDFF|nr:helix-turn-helix domain-containing protein [Streptomyces sp. CGMCC 4.1456]WNF67243.1 hypothetical protein RJD14_33845 [Streptomyces sp. CGMCC 4.1456]